MTDKTLLKQDVRDPFDIRKLVLDRRRECGIGLCGSYESIARWLFSERNIVASTSWVARVIAEGRP